VVVTNRMLAFGCVGKQATDQKLVSPKNHTRVANYNSEVLVMALAGLLPLDVL